MAENIPRMYVIDETYKALNGSVSKRWLRENAKNGTIVAIKCGRKILINYDKLLEYLACNTIQREQERQTQPCGIRPIPVNL